VSRPTLVETQIGDATRHVVARNAQVVGQRGALRIIDALVGKTTCRQHAIEELTDKRLDVAVRAHHVATLTLERGGELDHGAVERVGDAQVRRITRIVGGVGLLSEPWRIVCSVIEHNVGEEQRVRLSAEIGEKGTHMLVLHLGRRRAQ
jgi:hypothetical protein